MIAVFPIAMIRHTTGHIIIPEMKRRVLGLSFIDKAMLNNLQVLSTDKRMSLDTQRLSVKYKKPANNVDEIHNIDSEHDKSTLHIKRTIYSRHRCFFTLNYSIFFP